MSTRGQSSEYFMQVYFGAAGTRVESILPISNKDLQLWLIVDLGAARAVKDGTGMPFTDRRDLQHIWINLAQHS
jgi:hypothetical protein